MKALTLTQPWATLIAIGAKRVETRSWKTGYRGPLAIHAAKGLGPVGGMRGLAALCDTEPFRSALAPDYSCIGEGFVVCPGDLPRGAIVAVVELIDVVTTWAFAPDLHNLAAYGSEEQRVQAARELEFGNYEPGRYAWNLDRVRRLDVPQLCPGHLGLWNVPSHIAEALA